MRRFRKKTIFRLKAKQSKTRSISPAHAKEKKSSLLFTSKFFASEQSEINRAYFRFVSLLQIFCFATFHFQFFFTSKRNEINVFSLCFASKRNKINVFSLLFTSLDIDLKNYKTSLNIFLRFFTNLSQNFTLSFFALKFLLLFQYIFSSFHFRFTSDAKTSEKNLFRIKAKIFFAVFDSFSFCFHFVPFASDFYISHRCETSEKSENDGTPYPGHVSKKIP
jgi:hypothetical protein